MDDKQHDINQNRLYAALSYLWVLCFIPLLWRRKSHFAQYHAKQGLMLLIAGFFSMIVGWIPLFGYFFSILIGIILAILALFGIINALDGKYWQMPILGRYAKKIQI